MIHVRLISKLIKEVAVPVIRSRECNRRSVRLPMRTHGVSRAGCTFSALTKPPSWKVFFVHYFGIPVPFRALPF